MFNLVKKIDGQYNTPGDPHVVKVTATGAAIKAGTPVNINGGSVTVLGAATTVLATHLVTEDAASGATLLKVIDILPDMVFETVLTEKDDNGTASAPLCLIGAEVKVTTVSGYGFGVASAVTGAKWTGTVASTTATIASGIRGCIIYETPESIEAGTKVLVKFPAA